MSDFRSDPMPSADGHGRARAVWDAYVKASTAVFGPLIETAPVQRALRSVSAGTVSDLVGFWVLWHLHGGFDGLRELGMSRASIFRKTASFRRLFGAHPDAYEFPGISIDLEKYYEATKGRSES